jgi:hypothetical protein
LTVFGKFYVIGREALNPAHGHASPAIVALAQGTASPGFSASLIAGIVKP